MNYLYKTKPYNHQSRAFLEAWGALQSSGAFALFMEMGTGKSKVSIDIAANLFDQGKIDAVLVVAPNGIHAQWGAEQVPAHFPLASARFTWDNKTGKAAVRRLEDFIEGRYLKLKWFFVDVERFSTKGPYLRFFEKYLRGNRTLMIVDEATRIKNHAASRTKTITRLGALATYRMILTGTPLTNSPFDVYAPMEFLRPGFWGCNFFIFRVRYGLFVRDKNRATGAHFNRPMTGKDFALVRWHLEKGNTVEETAAYLCMSEADVRYIADRPGLSMPYKHLEALRGRLHGAAFFCKKSECLDLPEKIYTTIHVEMGEDQARIYRDLRDTLIAEYAGRDLTVQNKMTLYLRLQQVTGGFFPEAMPGDGNPRPPSPIGKTNPKIEALKHAIDEAPEGPIIIWSRFVAEIVKIESELQAAFPERRISSYYGGTEKKEKDEAVEKFKAGEIDILIINPASGAMGLNLQNSHLSFYFSNSYKLEDRLQSEDRTHRIGQKNHPQFVDLIVPGTVDEKIMQCLRDKTDLLEFFKEAPLETII